MESSKGHGLTARRFHFCEQEGNFHTLPWPWGGLLTYRQDLFTGHTEYQAIHGGDGREGVDIHQDLVPAL